MSDTVFVTNETVLTVVLVDKATGDVLDRSETTAELLSAHLTVLGITWNAESVSGGVKWWNPRTGELYPRGLAWHVEFTHPDTGEVVEAVVPR
jgi:hypothetical protein